MHEIDQTHLERKYTLRQNISVWLNVALISLSFISVSALIIYAGYKLQTINAQFSDLQTKIAEAGQNLSQVESQLEIRKHELEIKQQELSRTLAAFSSAQDTLSKTQAGGESGSQSIAALRAAVAVLNRHDTPPDWAQANTISGTRLRGWGSGRPSRRIW